MSITRCNISGSGSTLSSAGIIFQPFRPPTEGFIEKLISLPEIAIGDLGVGVEPLGTGVPPLDLDPDLSKLPLKFRALRASLCNSRALLELGLDGVEGLNKGESGATGDFLVAGRFVSILRFSAEAMIFQPENKYKIKVNYIIK